MLVCVVFSARFLFVKVDVARATVGRKVKDKESQGFMLLLSPPQPPTFKPGFSEILASRSAFL